MTRMTRLRHRQPPNIFQSNGPRVFKVQSLEGYTPRCCFGATHLVGELPRSNGQTTFGTHAPRDKENHPSSPKNAGEKARRSPRCCFGATHLVGELPRSNGQTTAWPSAPSRA
jgi:hypothetical protein